ncbi:MAG: protein-L-isoaspartate(D-aspartate) O-methyltransferase [Bacteroidales bacterium]|nr:protein-L-isoaspartate(D-aspartate) O-methyltransferase [Bacteroidales bacterium]
MMNNARYGCIILMLFFISCSSVSQPDYDEQRERMVNDQIIARGISDTRVIRAMKKVERHLFVPEMVRFRAYIDSPLPIGEGQTISQPYIVALMTEYLKLKPDMKVLEIGTGSGYQASILAEIVSEVYTMEIVESLGARAKKLLDSLGYDNTEVRIGNGYEGWEEHAPYDAIIVTCAPNNIPEPLKEQLAEGGRMIIPVGGRNIQHLILNRKRNGRIRQQSVLPVRFVPMVDGKGERY